MTVFDAGLQPERTELAWRRTALALAIGSLVMLRLLPAVFDDPWWVLSGVAGLIASGLLWGVTRRRFTVINALLRRDGHRAALPDAAPLAALAALGIVGGLFGLAMVLVTAFS